MEGNKRPEMERITTPELAEKFIAEQVEALRAQIGEGKVLLASTRPSLRRCSSRQWASSSSACM